MAGSLPLPNLTNTGLFRLHIAAGSVAASRESDGQTTCMLGIERMMLISSVGWCVEPDCA